MMDELKLESAYSELMVFIEQHPEIRGHKKISELCGNLLSTAYSDQKAIVDTLRDDALTPENERLENELVEMTCNAEKERLEKEGLRTENERLQNIILSLIDAGNKLPIARDDTQGLQEECWILTVSEARTALKGGG